MAQTIHQWTNRYQAPLPGGQVISTARPGEKIALAITEIQDAIDNMTGADGKGEESKELPDADDEITISGVENYKVLQVVDGVAVWDWVRATA